jgi:hypothetical protein
MTTGILTIEVDYDESGQPADVRVSGKGSGSGQLAAAGALIMAACQGSNITLRSGAVLMARQVGWDWLEHAITEAADSEDK